MILVPLDFSDAMDTLLAVASDEAACREEGLLLLTACADDAEYYVLADIDPPGKTEDPVFGEIVVQPMGMHRFGDGWFHPGFVSGVGILSIRPMSS